MEFTGSARPLTAAGLTSALAAIDFAQGEAAFIWTVVEVETAGITQGFGFRADRKPHILFERHKFRTFTDGRFNAEAPDLSGPQGGYGTLLSQYSRLGRALDLCTSAGLGSDPALKSASWGIGQVMGFNHTLAGHASVEAMVAAMVGGEDAQILAMASFLEGTGLARHLRNRDWTKFAVGYNGKNQAENKYDVKLAEAHQRLSSGSLPSLELRAAQAALLFLGHAPGKIDGVLGPRSRTALANFRLANGLAPSDSLDAATFDKLFKAAGWS